MYRQITNKDISYIVSPITKVKRCVFFRDERSLNDPYNSFSMNFLFQNGFLVIARYYQYVNKIFEFDKLLIWCRIAIFPNRSKSFRSRLPWFNRDPRTRDTPRKNNNDRVREESKGMRGKDEIGGRVARDHNAITRSFLTRARVAYIAKLAA